MADGDVEDLLRSLAPQVLGALVRRYGHFDTAEDATQETLLAAATRWPDTGLPDDPKAWLITVAARRLTDLLRAEQARRRPEDSAARRLPPDRWLAPPADRQPDDADDTLILLFLCCHPSLPPAGQIALTLRAGSRREDRMDADAVRAVLRHCLDHSGTDEDAAHEIYHADAVLEFRAGRVARETIYVAEGWPAGTPAPRRAAASRGAAVAPSRPGQSRPRMMCGSPSSSPKQRCST